MNICKLISRKIKIHEERLKIKFVIYAAYRSSEVCK